MKRQRQEINDIVSKLTPVDASWLDDHAADCISFLGNLPIKKRYSKKDVATLLDTDFRTAQTVIRLFLDCSKDEMTYRLKEELGPGGIGVTRYSKNPEPYLQALETMGLLEKMKGAVNTPLHWSDLLVERLKGGRGSAIKGQQRGRGLEDLLKSSY